MHNKDGSVLKALGMQGIAGNTIEEGCCWILYDPLVEIERLILVPFGC
jgi:hypothetical protein